ncbi:MAG: glycosyltransferase family 39 protein [Phycisphaerae bacterium]
MLPTPAEFSSPRQLPLWLLLLCAVAGVACVCGGPPLAEHEGIVALIARQTLRDGDWLFPRCMDEPFLIKPPLTPWLIAVAAKLLPADAATGLPVSAIAARLPSLLATVGTVLVLWRLSRTMFGPALARLTAFLYATMIGSWLFALNATAEAGLTFFCTLGGAAFYWAISSATPAQRRAHLLLFYVAFGLAMLTKGPMPLSVLGVPLAAWWFLERAVRAWAAGGMGSIGHAGRLAILQFARRLWSALTRLGLIWGLPLFALCFVPWMFYVAHRWPAVWELWNFEYLQRFKGHYSGKAQPGPWYYVPILLGLAAPWCLSLPEALASPFLARYRAQRRALTFAWFWSVVGLGTMAVMTFKKPYYILPALPGCALLLTPVLARLFLHPAALDVRRARWAVAAAVGGVAVAAVVGQVVAQRKYAEVFASAELRWAIPAGGAALVAGVALCGWLYLRGRRAGSLATLGLTALSVASLTWIGFGPRLASADDAVTVARELDRRGIPPGEPLYWISNRPDARLPFYSHRTIRRALETYRLMAAEAGDEVDNLDSQRQVAERAAALLDGQEPVLMLFQRGQLKRFQEAFRPTRLVELFSVDRGRPGDDRSDWVVISNVPRWAKRNSG